MTGALTQVYIDVDGVINAQPDSPDDLEHWPPDTWQRRHVNFGAPMGSGTLTWNLAAIDSLHMIENTPDVHMWWCTTWGNYAVELLAPNIGIGHDWRVAPWHVRNTPSSLDWWKAAHVRHALQHSDDRVVWIDDEITQWQTSQRNSGNDGELAWLNTDRLLTICPNTRCGLTPEHFNEIEAFLC
ncbi:hypothetical protein [Demequina globuliformis]|uniref:hypothetical protein n=1 Tax=Demequina globuliformis TaxID=676202 RepID=UPI000780D379|nr:hypothetical protein [Demequina globuliformis]